jgi:hypothetical protein
MANKASPPPRPPRPPPLPQWLIPRAALIANVTRDTMSVPAFRVLRQHILGTQTLGTDGGRGVGV